MCACVLHYHLYAHELGDLFFSFFHASTNVITIYNFGIMFIPLWVYRSYKFRSFLNHFCLNSQVEHFMPQTYFSLVQKTFQFVKSIYIVSSCNGHHFVWFLKGAHFCKVIFLWTPIKNNKTYQIEKLKLIMHSQLDY
jgi:hypothetical protein